MSFPFSSRTCSVSPAPSARRSRKRRATSVPRPPMRASVRSTFETRSGVVRRLEDDVRERLGRRHHRRAVAPALAERPRERAAEGAPRLGDLRLRPIRLDLERDVEPRDLDEALEQPVEHRQAGLDRRRAGSTDLHANPAPSRCRHRRGEATGGRSAEDGPFGPCGAAPALRYSTAMAWLRAMLAAAAPAQPVTIAVVDTGADLRTPDIAASTPLAYDVRSRSHDVRDLNGHGTLVASIVAARAAAPAADRSRRQLERRVQRRERSSGDPLRGRSRRAHRQPQPRRAAHVDCRARRRALRDRRGVLLVAAAGDDYANRPEYPAALLGPDGLAVAAVMRDGSRALFSNTGPWVSVAALGEEGTSFAAPLVSAAAATVGPRIRASPRGRSSRFCRRPPRASGRRDDELGFGSSSRGGVALALALRSGR